MTTTTHALLEQLLTRMGAGDGDKVAELFAERVDWKVAGSPSVPWIRDRSVRADVADHFRSLDAALVADRRAVSLTAVVVEGDDAVVTCEVSQTVAATGRSFTIPVALHVTFEDGLVVRYHVYEDSLTVAEACAIPPDGQLDAASFANRYLAIWNEPDAAVRREAVERLWHRDAVHCVESGEHRGHDAIERRVATAHSEYVGDGGFVFEPTEAAGHHGAITFGTRMVRADGEDAAWRGSVVVVLDHDGRIRTDHHFSRS